MRTAASRKCHNGSWDPAKSGEVMKIEKTLEARIAGSRQRKKNAGWPAPALMRPDSLRCASVFFWTATACASDGGCGTGPIGLQVGRLRVAKRKVQIISNTPTITSANWHS